MVVVSLTKLAMMGSELYFVTIDGMENLNTIPIFSFDSFEIMTHSPRYMSIFMWSFMAKARYTGKKDTLNALQYSILRYMPAYIAWQSIMEVFIKKQMVLTMDDTLLIVMYLILRDVELHIPHNDCITYVLYRSFYGEAKPLAEEPVAPPSPE